MEIKYKYKTVGLKTPKYATEKSSCFDIYAAEDVVLKPSECKQVHTGLYLEPPEGYGIMLYPRSGISAKTMLRFANSVFFMSFKQLSEKINNLIPEHQKNMERFS